MESIEQKVLKLIESVCRLHLYDKINVSDAVQQLTNQGFYNISVEFVQTVYDQLVKDVRKDITPETIKNRVLKLTRAISQLHRYNEIAEFTAVLILKSQGFEDVTVEFIQSIYDQLEKEANKQMETSIKNANKSHYYCLALNEERRDSFVFSWSERYFFRSKCQVTDPNFHELELFDSFNDKFRQVLVKKNASILQSIHPLKDNFGILFEREEHSFFVSLIVLDFIGLICKKLRIIEYVTNQVHIEVNPLDSTEFVLNLLIENKTFARNCKINGKDIHIGEAVQVPFPCSHFGGRLFGMKDCQNQSDLIQTLKVFVYRIQQGKSENFDVNLLEIEGYYTYRQGFFSRWIADKLFVPLQIAHGGFSIAYLNVQSRRWTVMDFVTENLISELRLFNGNDLIIRTIESSEDSIDFYKISIRKPDLLQKIAWITLVKYMNKRKLFKFTDPYELARYYLPSDSVICCPFVEPKKDEKTKTPKKRYKKTSRLKWFFKMLRNIFGFGVK